ncbi:MAG: ORF6N domain-containing protein [Actinomycetota bacterium]
MRRLIPRERIEGQILLIRDQRVMLDSDLAKLYGVPTRRLNEQVRRNIARFPQDFMLQLTADEARALRSQDVTSKPGRGGRRYAPLVFTEQGVAMLSSVLHSERAVRVNIEIMRAFVRLRAMAYTYKDLANKIHALEQKYDGQFKVVFDAIRALMETPEPPPPGGGKRRIGFRPKDDQDGRR